MVLPYVTGSFTLVPVYLIDKHVHRFIFLLLDVLQYSKNVTT